jgi:uncharacterized OsmC-like protein
MADKTEEVRKRQNPRREQFIEDPDAAWVTDKAETTGVAPNDPFHGEVLPDKATNGPWKYGIHEKVGGKHDAPTSGDILCAALATCLESTVRMITGQLGVELEELQVQATAEVDVRGTLLVDPDVPVEFQAMHCQCRMVAADGTEPELLERVSQLAERCCIVLQTLRGGVSVDTSFDLSPST